MKYYTNQLIYRLYLHDKAKSKKQIKQLEKLRLANWTEEGELHRQWQIGLLKVRYNEKFEQMDGWNNYLSDWRNYLRHI